MSDSKGITCTACPSGTFLNPSTLTCATCQPGFISADGEASCVACPPNTFAANSSTCNACPPESLSGQGSSSVLQCLCAFGYYQLFSGANLSAPAFTCMLCPDGALCTGDATPLALAGFWHLPGNSFEFYDCEKGWCLAEESAPLSNSSRRLLGDISEIGGLDAASNNCRVGHTGNVCGECIEGWTLMSGHCAPCPPHSSFNEWPQPLLGGIIFAAVLSFLVSTTLWMLSPIIQPGKYLKNLKRRLQRNQPAEHGTVRHGVSAVLQQCIHFIPKAFTFANVPLRLVIENLQACPAAPFSVSSNACPDNLFLQAHNAFAMALRFQPAHAEPVVPEF
jgi:hypothetical protein